MLQSYWCGEGDGGGENAHLLTHALQGACVMSHEL